MRYVFICLLLVNVLVSLFAVFPGWTNYTWGQLSSSVCGATTDVWVGTNGGVKC